jgi:DNA-directed RNA polymerase specialized sigma24 family protein
MQQTAVLERGLDHPTPADDQLRDAGDHAAAPVATAELVARARIGEQAAWDQLVERYGTMVWTVARGYDLGLEDAADVSQVTWLLLTQHLGSLSQPDRLGAWLFTTATREAVRMRRLRGAGGPIAAGHDGNDPWRQGSAAEVLVE